MKQPLPVPFFEAVEGVTNINRALMADAVRCGEWLKTLPSVPANQVELDHGQFVLRTFVRTFFALVEGVTFSMREVALRLHSLDLIKLSPAEYCVLAEKRFTCDGGKPKEVTAFNHAIDNIQLAFLAFAKAYGSEFCIDKSDCRWNSFRKSLRTRDALTHPKSPADVQLTAEVIREFADAVGWFSGQMSGILKSVNDRLGADA